MNKIITKIKDFISMITSKIGDKNMHIICSFLITFIFGLFNILAGVIISFMAGFAKEIYDQFRYENYGEGTGFDKADIAYDIVGILVAVAILLLL